MKNKTFQILLLLILFVIGSIVANKRNGDQEMRNEVRVESSHGKSLIEKNNSNPIRTSALQRGNKNAKTHSKEVKMH